MVVLEGALQGGGRGRPRNIHAYAWPGDATVALCGRTIVQPVVSGQWGGPWRHLRTAELTRMMCWDCGRLADAMMRTETIRPGLGAARIALDAIVHALEGGVPLCGVDVAGRALTPPWTGLADWHAVLAHPIIREEACAECYRASYDPDSAPTPVPIRRGA